MGKRKPKEPDTISQNDAASTPSNVFKALFGDVEQSAASSSIFSDSNPFKRKPQESRLLFGSNQNPNNNNIDTENANVDELNKRTKEVKTQNPNLGSESNEVSEEVGEGNPNVGFDPKEENNNNKRKKRKRDEIEMEYEAKKYGTVPDNKENVAVVVGEKRKKVDNEADMLVLKGDGEGFDDEGKLLRTVFVGNLPMKVKKKALMKEFSQFGEIESVRVRSVPIMDTKIPRKGAIMTKKINDAADSVHAYIVFKTDQSAKASLAHNMVVVGGNHIRVDRACPPRKKLKGEDAPLYDNKRTVFVGNLPFDVKDEEIYQLFSGIKDLDSSIEAVRVIRDPHIGLGKGIAYVLFKTREAANVVVKKRNLKLRARELRLSHARQDSTPSKRRNPFAAETANSPAKKVAADLRTPDRNNGSNTKAAMSYQGLHASKSGAQKKVHSVGHAKRNAAVKMKSNAQKGEKRQGKRPAVAARKAKTKAVKDGSASKQTGQKRKLDSRTPESANRKKKAKKFR